MKTIATYETALARIFKLQALQREARKTVEELRLSIEVERECVLNGIERRQVCGLARFEQLNGYLYETLRRKFKKLGAVRSDYILLHLEDGREIECSHPIRSA